MASPTNTSSKRSLEETSPGYDAVPDAKRPALEQNNEVKQVVVSKEEEKPASAAETKEEPAKAESSEEQNGQTQNAAAAAAAAAAADGSEQQSSSHAPVDESNWIHIRAIVSNTEAATIIGRGGENITLIRKTAETKLTISDYQRGAVERVLTISGPVDSVAKVRNFLSLFWFVTTDFCRLSVLLSAH